MPRRAQVTKREIPPDSKYQSTTVAKFINKIMTRGKKSKAEAIFYEAMHIIEQRVNRNPVDAFDQAIRNATPVLQVKSRRVGGATYQVPVEVTGGRGMSIAMRWLVQSSRKRGGKSMAEKLAAELMDADQGVGVTIKKRADTHRMAEANKAFAHYRW